jgi:hypothetical protein
MWAESDAGNGTVNMDEVDAGQVNQLFQEKKSTIPIGLYGT